MNTFETLINWDKASLLSLNSWHSPWMDNVMWLMSQTLIWLPFFVVLLFLIVKNKQSDSLLLLLILAILIVFTDQVSSGIFKPLIHRLRPTHDPEIGNLVHLVKGYKGGQYGFFSSHAANVFALAGFSLLVIRKTYYTIAVILWASIVSYSRIYMGVHYPLDVITGVVFGLMASVLFFKLYQILENRRNGRRQTPKIKTRKKSTSLFSDVEVAALLLVLMTILITCLTAAKKMV